MTTITTVPVTCRALRPDGTPIAGGTIRFLLSEPDTENGVVVPREVGYTTDTTGMVVAQLWPNSKGGAGTTYRVLVNDPLGGITSLGTATVPNSACNLWQIIDLGPPATVDAATIAKLAAQAAAADADTSAAAAHADRVQADSDAVATAADRVQTGLDRTATAADRVQTGLDRVATAADRVQTGLDRTSTTASAATATTEAGVATAQAAISTEKAGEAASSATSTAALLLSFRSAWLGAFATDSAATAFATTNSISLVSGVAYENTTEGKPRIYDGAAWGDYDATAHASQIAAALSAANAAASAAAALASQVAAAASAATASGVLSDSGFIAVHSDLANIDSVAGSITNVNAVATALSTLASIAADLTTLNSIAADLSTINVVAGDHTAIVTVAGDKTNIDAVAADVTNINLVAGSITQVDNVAADLTALNALAAALTALNAVYADLTSINTVAGDTANINAVAADTANINAVAGDLTNLNAIAAALTALNSIYSDLTNINAVAANLTAINSANANATTATTQAGIATTQATAAAASAVTAASQASLSAGYAASAGSAIQQDISGVTAKALLRFDNANNTSVFSMFVYDTTKDSDGGAWTEHCQHTSWYNEPLNGNWMGSHNSDLAAHFGRAVLGSEMIANGTFDSSTTGWTASGTGASIASVNGQLVVTSGSGGNGQSRQSLTTVIGTTYKLAVDFNAATGAGNIVINAGTTAGGYDLSSNSIAPNLTQTFEFTFVATSTTTYVTMGASSAASSTATFDNVSFKPITSNPTAANDYYQNNNDGYFYKISKNFLASTATLATQTQWLAAGTYTLSSTTGSSGSVAVSGAATASHTAGTPTTFTVATQGNVTFTVTGSVLTAQCEAGSSATTYSANTTASRSALTYRGNTAKFPKLCAIVGFGERLNNWEHKIAIFDLTQPGFPMWMVFTGDVYGNYLITSPVYGVCMLNGVMAVASDYNGGAGYASSSLTNFPADKLRRYQYSICNNAVGIVNRNSATLFTVPNDGYFYGGGDYVYAGTHYVAMCVMPNAPVDPQSGLPIPTVVWAGPTGTYVEQNTGLRAGNNGGTAGTTVVLTQTMLAIGRADGTLYYVPNPSAIAVGYSFSSKANTSAPDFGAGNTVKLVAQNRSDLLRASATAATVQKLHNNEAVIGKGLSATITNVFNTGYEVGDIRRTYLADSVVGTISNPSTVSDRTYKAASATVYGTLTRALCSPGASNQLVAYSGFSASNYLQEPYSADLDFATGEWNVSAWVNIPTTLPTANFGIIGSELIADPNFATPADWSLSSGASVSGGVLTFTGVASTAGAAPTPAISITAGKCYLVTYTITSLTLGSINIYLGSDHSPYVRSAAGTYTEILYCRAGTSSSILSNSASTSAVISNFSVKEISIAPIADRSYSSGASLTLGVDGCGYIHAIAYDGTTTRSVASTGAAYNTGITIKAEAVYRADGSLAINVNGVQVAITYGNPLLTLTNTSAVLTIGNNRALNSPFPGSIALLKLSATAPSQDQIVWMYEQEKHIFRDGVNALLPDSGNIVDMAYDEVTDKWSAVSSTNESDWTGLIRTNVVAAPIGSNTLIAAGSGVKLNARSTIQAGVDITMPALGLREELIKRAEAKRKLQPAVVFDFTGGFTCTTVNGNTAITSVASLAYPAQGSLYGASVSGSGIPAGTTIVGINGTTIYLSKAATASASSVQISFLDFILPVGYETRVVSTAGATKQEGSTKDWTRSFDGFREKVTFGTAPGYSAFVEIEAVRSITQ